MPFGEDGNHPICPALTSPRAHAGLPMPMLPATAQPNVKTVTRTERAREQPIRAPLTRLVFEFLELRFLMPGFTWRAIGASDRLRKCYLLAPDFAARPTLQRVGDQFCEGRLLNLRKCGRVPDQQGIPVSLGHPNLSLLSLPSKQRDTALDRRYRRRLARCHFPLKSCPKTRSKAEKLDLGGDAQKTTKFS
jgi:hypothetical protein